ncbi:MAG: hypothetical protein KGS00_13750 [Alphaproteobacteria bacterium]|nr:hypothetical protein [Alphaproteobacteria bacterium]
MTLLEAKRTNPHARTWVRVLVDPRAGDEEAGKVAQAIAEHGRAPGVIIRRIVDPLSRRHAH